MYRVPSAKLAGSTEARIRKYVGEHVENIGPRDAPIITSPQILFFWYPFPRSWLDCEESFASPGMFSHIAGKRSVIPNSATIPPEMYVHTCCGTMTNALDAFKRYVKRIIDSASEPTTIYGVERRPPCAEVPTTTGKRGSMHGARTVSTPAMNEIISSVILYLFYFSHKCYE
jgi:hypothetical protein